MVHLSKSVLKSTVFWPSLAETLAFGVLLAIAGTGAALAQSADAPVEEITVTGSRIKTSDAISAGPVTIVTADTFDKTKAVNVEQILRKLPAIDFVGGISANTNNNGFGSSTVGIPAFG